MLSGQAASPPISSTDRALRSTLTLPCTPSEMRAILLADEEEKLYAWQVTMLGTSDLRRQERAPDMLRLSTLDFLINADVERSESGK